MPSSDNLIVAAVVFAACLTGHAPRSLMDALTLAGYLVATLVSVSAGKAILRELLK